MSYIYESTQNPVEVYSKLAHTLATDVFTAVLLGGGPASSPSPFAEQLSNDVRA